MSLTALLAGVAGLGAVLAFWALGAHNRLVGLRNRLARAWSPVHDAVAQRSAALPALEAALRAPLAAETGALQAWAGAHATALEAARAMAARGFSAAAAQAFVAAEAELAARGSRVLALVDSQPALAAEDGVAAARAAWQAAQARLPFARQAFNDAADAHNAALAAFPTRLLVGAFRFAPAGRC